MVVWIVSMYSPPASACWPLGKWMVCTRPPTRSRASRTTTSKLLRRSSKAAARPASPAPTTTTRPRCGAAATSREREAPASPLAAPAASNRRRVSRLASTPASVAWSARTHAPTRAATRLLAYAPRETRTPTPHTRDKALNLASCVFAVSVVSRLSALRRSRKRRWTIWTFCDGVDVANVLPTNRPGEIAAAASLAGGGHSQDRADPDPRLLAAHTAVAAVRPGRRRGFGSEVGGAHVWTPVSWPDRKQAAP